MRTDLRHSCNQLLDHYLVTLLFLALVVLTFSGVGNALIVGLLGILLCMAGIIQGAVVLDPWGMVLLLTFDLCSMASSIPVYHTPAAGFAATQTIFTVIYLLIAYLNDAERQTLRRLGAGWAGCVAGIGALQFTSGVYLHRASRLGGLLGNPNALGIFLVLGWFALENDPAPPKALRRLEPVLLAALALTLSMGSFLSMAVGILILLLARWKRSGWNVAFCYACQVLSRAVVGVGIGLLLYIAGRKTDVPLLSTALVLYLLAAAILWPTFLAFLEHYPRIAAAATGFGVVVTAVVVLIRPSAIATFLERLEMMRNALSYIFRSPLLGVGPYQWRLLNYNDTDTYFNTWHIHNLFLHVGVELGLVAMAALIVLAVRHFRKKDGPKSGSAAFLLHCMMDTGFFYESIPGLAMLTIANPSSGGRRMNTWAVRAVFAGLGAYFVCVLVQAM